jgi:hypothetical protein
MKIFFAKEIDDVLNFALTKKPEPRKTDNTPSKQPPMIEGQLPA